MNKIKSIRDECFFYGKGSRFFYKLRTSSQFTGATSYVGVCVDHDEISDSENLVPLAKRNSSVPRSSMNELQYEVLELEVVPSNDDLICQDCLEISKTGFKKGYIPVEYRPRWAESRATKCYVNLESKVIAVCDMHDNGYYKPVWTRISKEEFICAKVLNE